MEGERSLFQGFWGRLSEQRLLVWNGFLTSRPKDHLRPVKQCQVVAFFASRSLLCWTGMGKGQACQVV